MHRNFAKFVMDISNFVVRGWFLILRRVWSSGAVAAESSEAQKAIWFYIAVGMFLKRPV